MDYVEFSCEVEVLPGIHVSRLTRGAALSRAYGGAEFETPGMYIVGDDLVLDETGDRFPLPGIVRRYRLVS